MKDLIIDQAIYWEQIYARILNHFDNYCYQYYKGLILLQLFLIVVPFHHFYL